MPFAGGWEDGWTRFKNLQAYLLPHILFSLVCSRQKPMTEEIYFESYNIQKISIRLLLFLQVNVTATG